MPVSAKQSLPSLLFYFLTNGLINGKHLQSSKTETNKLLFSLMKCISQKEISVLQGNLGVGILLLAIPENPHRLLIFLGVGRAVRMLVGWQFQEQPVNLSPEGRAGCCFFC